MVQNGTGSPERSAADALWRLYHIDLGAGPGPQQAERDALAAQIGESLMCRYRYNREAKLRPVVQLRDGQCPECGTNYAQCHELMKLMHSGDVRGCYTCGRLITFVKTTENLQAE